MGPVALSIVDRYVWKEPGRPFVIGETPVGAVRLKCRWSERNEMAADFDQVPKGTLIVRDG